jgi:hypothetical protein
MVTVHLSPDHLTLAARIGRGRLAANRKTGRHSARVSKWRTDEEVQIQGAAGEVAVALAEHRPINCIVCRGDEVSTMARGPDVGEWQIKTTAMNPPLLMVPKFCVSQQKDHKYLLCYAQLPKVVICGWAFASDLFREENVRAFPHYDAYVMFLSQLRSYPPMGSASGFQAGRCDGRAPVGL